jgi:predicted O-methyltransferase YrrM
MTACALWTNVDHYIEERLLAPDALLDAALETSHAAGLPPIHVAANQGKLLQLLALAIGARRILEIGTLGGYSTIWLARALPHDGRLVSLELDAKYAELARANIARCGLADQVEIRVGPAIDTLAALPGEPPFDLVFIDADKPSNPEYLDAALRLTRPGSLIVVDNVVREGGVLDAQGDAAVQGVRRLFDRLGAEPRVTATALQTVGCKGHDGFAIALVLSVEEPMQSEPE